MNKIRFLISALMIISVVGYAESNRDKIGFNVGATSINSEDKVALDNLSLGLTYEFAEFGVDGLTPRLDFDYVKISDYKDVTGLFKGSINGIYEFGDYTILAPYAIGGVGYEYVAGGMEDEFESHMFAQGGLGLKHSNEAGFDVKVEAKALQIIGGSNQENELIVTAGIAIPIGEARNIGKVQEDCPIKIDEADEDRDGITDTVDQCPGTPCYFTVDVYGCPTKATLRIHFEVNKAVIRNSSFAKVENFAQFLLGNKGSNIQIEGHTDSDGDDDYNMILSEKRANAVMNKLVHLGVSPNRLSAVGKGEREPMASNATASGKSLNRRIEVKLTYPKK